MKDTKKKYVAFVKDMQNINCIYSERKTKLLFLS